MMRTLSECCETFCRDGRFNFALFDDNGNSCYSKGGFQVSNSDVSGIRNALVGASKGPYVLQVAGIGFLCIKSTDQILYGKGGFNEQLKDIELYRGLTQTARNEADSNVRNDNSISKVKEEDKEGRVSKDDYTEMEINVTSKESDPSNHVNSVTNQQVSVTRDNESLSPGEDDKDKKVVLPTPVNHGVSFAAMLVKNYIVMMHGSQDRSASWLSTMTNFRDKISKYI